MLFQQIPISFQKRLLVSDHQNAVPMIHKQRILVLDSQTDLIFCKTMIRTFQFPNKSVFLAKDLHYFNIRSTESFFWFWIHKMSFQQKPISHQNQLLVLDPQNDIPTILSLQRDWGNLISPPNFFLISHSVHSRPLPCSLSLSHLAKSCFWF